MLAAVPSRSRVRLRRRAPRPCPSRRCWRPSGRRRRNPWEERRHGAQSHRGAAPATEPAFDRDARRRQGSGLGRLHTGMARPADGPLLPPGAVPPGREPVRALRPARAGARRRRAARPAAQQFRRGQHRARPPGAADRLHRFQRRRAVAHGDAPQGAAAQARARDRSADPASLRGREGHGAANSIRSSSTAIRRSSSSRARWPRPPTTSAAFSGLLENLTKDTQNLLTQQARTITELQNGLMRTRMVPFQRHVQRLARIVRQAATRHAQEGRARHRGRLGRTRSPGARAHDAAVRAHAAQCRRARHRVAGGAQEEGQERDAAPSPSRCIARARKWSSKCPTTAPA